MNRACQRSRFFSFLRPMAALLLIFAVGSSAAGRAENDGLVFSDRILSPPPVSERVPGLVIDHSAAQSKVYLGSPSLAVLPGGIYAASHDYFGPDTKENVTAVYVSADRGKSWQPRAQIEGQYWSTLFFHRGELYLIGTSEHNGYTVIRRSRDQGVTWSEPLDRKSGRLLDDGRYHCAPVPIVEHDGRLWRGMEAVVGSEGWGRHFQTFMMSVPAESDLLDGGNWICSNRIPGDPDWLNGKFGGWLEGNAVITPVGGMVNILRVDYRPEGGQAARVEISPDGKRAVFDPARGFIDFPGGCKKFAIRYDAGSGRYWSLSNAIPGRHRGANPERTRNTLALIHSADLTNWSVRSVVLYHPDVEKHGFQYVDWHFEGEDIIFISRTAYDDRSGGAHNQHDANYITFHRIRNYLQYR